MFADDTNISIPGRTLADLQPLINAELVNRNNCWLRVLRWLDTVFQGQYLSSLSINYVAINKVLEKDKDENLL